MQQKKEAIQRLKRKTRDKQQEKTKIRSWERVGERQQEDLPDDKGGPHQKKL